MTVHAPSIRWAACIRAASGSQEVPDPSRDSGIASGPVIDIGCCMSIWARSDQTGAARSARVAATEPRSVLSIVSSPRQNRERAPPRAALGALRSTGKDQAWGGGDGGVIKWEGYVVGAPDRTVPCGPCV